MLYEFHLDESYGTNITAAERNALIRYCLTIGTRGKCATKALLRPFKQKYLKEAFAEQSKEHIERIGQYERAMQEYDPETARLPQGMLDYFGGIPTKEAYTRYCRQIVKQEREVLRSLKRSYSVYVDYAFLGRKLLAFHNSLHPRVTFGYSNSLHEVCDFAFDEATREAFLNSSLAVLPQYKDDWAHDWGNVYFGSLIELFYEDLEVFLGERCVLSTLSHEKGMTVSLTEEELAAFGGFEGKRRKNLATIKKLRSLQAGGDQ